MNMFDQAKKDAPAKAAAVTNDKTPRVETDGVKEASNLTSLIKTLTTMLKTLNEDLKDKAFEHFLKVGMKHHRQPVNYRGVEDGFDTMMMMNKRSVSSPLSDDEVDQLTKAGISTESRVSVEEAYIINKKYAGNSELLEQVSKKMSEIKDFPTDFIEFRAEVSTTVTTSESINEVFALKNTKLVRALLRIVTVMAIKPSGNDSMDATGDAVISIRKIIT